MMLRTLRFYVNLLNKTGSDTVQQYTDIPRYVQGCDNFVIITNLLLYRGMSVWKY